MNLVIFQRQIILFNKVKIIFGDDPGRQAQKREVLPKKGAKSKAKKEGFFEKATRDIFFVLPVKALFSILDGLAMPFGTMRGKEINPPLLLKAGIAFICISFFSLFLIQNYSINTSNQSWVVKSTFLILKVTVPSMLLLCGTMMLLGSYRLKRGRSFYSLIKDKVDPIPAFKSGLIFSIGDIKLSLRDMHTNIGAFGGIGTGKTVSVMVPLMRQFFQLLNHDTDDPSDEAQKVGALILDEKGDFIDSTIMEMMLAGRPITDLVLIDPDLDLFRYNPLDPSQSADENAEKLGKVQKIISGGNTSSDRYWEDTSKSTIKFFLQLLEVYKPKEKIGLDDVARFMRDDELAKILCDEVQKKINEKKSKNEINDETYGAVFDAISATRNQWINLSANTKSILKTTINQMLSSLASNPRLQKVFCRDTNFSFKDLPNKGKIVLFRGSGIDKSTAKLICVCLKIDFQTWQKRRNGSAAAAYGLNTTRTVLFICDEYQEFVTCGDEGDQTFYGVSRSAKTCAIIATQSLNSLKGAIKNQEQTNTLIQNIATWIFLRTTDKDTMELGALWAGQSKKEDYSQSQSLGGMIEVATSISGASGSGGSNVNISKKLEENFRKDDFSKLITITMEKSAKGPWYSEAIVYHYHDIDADAESKCYKTRLPHYYYDPQTRKRASENVFHLDNILYDRNWQRKILQRVLPLIQLGKSKEEFEIKIFQKKLNEQANQKKQRKAEEEQKRKEAIKSHLEKNVTQNLEIIQQKTKGLPIKGSASYDPETETSGKPDEEIKERIKLLKDKKKGASSPEENRAIEEEIQSLSKRLSESILSMVSKDADRSIPQNSEHIILNETLLSNLIPAKESKEPSPDTDGSDLLSQKESIEEMETPDEENDSGDEKGDSEDEEDGGSLLFS